MHAGLLTHGIERTGGGSERDALVVTLLTGPVLAFTADLVGFAVVGEDSDGCSDLERSVLRKGLSEIGGDLAKTWSTVRSRHKQSGAVATLDGELLGSPALYQLTFLSGGRSGGGRDRVISDAAWNLLKRSLLRVPVRMSDKLRDRLAPSFGALGEFHQVDRHAHWDEVRVSVNEIFVCEFL